VSRPSDVARPGSPPGARAPLELEPGPEAPAVARAAIAEFSGPIIRLEITDRGSGFTPRPRDPSQIGGYGLYLLNQAAADWGVEHSGGSTLWFEIPAGAI
jgi:hypothetical protein